MPSLKLAQTVKSLKEAQTAFKNLKTSTKTAFDDPSMGMGDKDMMIEKIFQQAEALVDTAITAVEAAENGGGMENGIENGIGEPEVIPTDIPNITNEPDKKLNVAAEHNEDEDKMKLALDETNDKVNNLEKELDAMKHKEAQMKLAQRYADLHPVAMRTAKFNEFMSHKAPTAVLEARLDEAVNFMSKANAVKIAQEEDSIFKLEDLESTTNNRVNTRGKI